MAQCSQLLRQHESLLALYPKPRPNAIDLPILVLLLTSGMFQHLTEWRYESTCQLRWRLHLLLGDQLASRRLSDKSKAGICERDGYLNRRSNRAS